MMPRKFTDAQLDQAEQMRDKGMRWIVIESCLGEGIKNAVHYRDHIGYIGTYNEEIETQQALSAWNGIGDRQSFIDGYKSRAKRERVFK